MKQLPNTIHRESVAEREQKRYDSRQESLQTNVVGLSDLINVKFESTEQLEAVTTEWLDDQISKSKSNLRTIFGTNGGFIPAGISQQFADNYEAIRKAARPFIEGIQDGLTFAKSEQIPLKFDSKGRPWLDEKVVREKVKESALYSFTEEEKEFYGLIAPIFDALDEVRKYEKEHGLISSDLKKVLSEYIESADLQRAKYTLTPEKYYTLTSYGKVLARLRPTVKKPAEEEKGGEK